MAAFAISALPLVEFSQTSALTLQSTKGMVASVLVAFAGQGALTWNHTVPVRASAEVAFAGQAKLWHGRLRALVAHGEVVFTGVVHTCTLANGATVRDAVRSIVALWGQSSGSDDSPEVAEAVGFLNAAIQRLHESGKDYGFVGRVRRSYTGTVPVDSVELESDVQHVDGAATFRLPRSGWTLVFDPHTGRIDATTGSAISEGRVLVTGTSGLSAWNLSTVYAVNAIVINDGIVYRCGAGHTSGSISEPGVGGDWTDYWDDYTAISYGADVASRLEEITGCPCTFVPDATAPSIEILRSEGSDAAWEGIPFTQGSICTGITWVLSSAMDLTAGGDADFTPGTLTPLRPIDFPAALQSFRSRFSGVVYPGTTLRRPVTYLARADNSGARSPLVNIELAPVAEYVSGNGDADTWELQADVFLEPPRFSCCDVRNGTRLPVPHRYAESLVIPLARYMALSARYRVQESTVAMVREQAAQALALIGEVDPRAKEVQENRKEVPK